MKVCRNREPARNKSNNQENFYYSNFESKILKHYLVWLFFIYSQNPSGKNIIKHNQLLKKLPDGIKGTIFIIIDKFIK